METELVICEGEKHVNEGYVFIYCQEGDRLYRKDPYNNFRGKLKLIGVSKLSKYGTPQKLMDS